VNVKPAEAAIVVRHFLDQPTVHELAIVSPPGVRFEPAVATLRVEPSAVRFARAVNRRYNRRTKCGDYGFHPRNKRLAESRLGCR
jgi:hypothetical protein